MKPFWVVQLNRCHHEMHEPQKIVITRIDDFFDRFILWDRIIIPINWLLFHWEECFGNIGEFHICIMNKDFKFNTRNNYQM